MAETPIVPRKRFSLQTLSYAVTGIVVAFLAGLSFLVASHLAQLQHIAEESRTVTIPLALEQSNTNQILRQISLLAEIVANNPSAQDRIRASRDALRLLRTLMNRSPSTRKSIFNDIFRSLQQLSVFTDNLHKERENLTLILQKISAQHSDKEALDILRLRLHMSSIAAIIDLAQLNHAKEEYARLFKAASPRTQALFTGYIELFGQQKSIIILHAKIDRLTLEIHQKLALAALESSGNAALVASNAAATIAERARTARTAALGGFGILASAFFFLGLAIRKEVVKPALEAGNALFALSRGKDIGTLARSDLREIDAISQAVRRMATALAETEAANQRLIAMAQMKTNFTSSVSHELRTPLTSIRGFIKLIRRDMERLFAGHEDSEKVSRILDNLNIISGESVRLSILIDDVLDIAKIESGRMAWRDAPTDIADVIRRTAQAIMGEFALRPEIHLAVKIASPLPRLVIDGHRLQQVLLNLLNNSIKFTQAGQVTLCAHQDNNAIIVEVTDTGIGIRPEDVNRIFEKFQQGSAPVMTDKPRGTGLGLAICKQIVEHYGGQIEVLSTLGHGSRFRVLLPLSLQNQEAYHA
ncbi:MAG: sensor histidine kinase [Holosporales bacterium]|jgi:signal transduction histidine kinase